MTVRVRVKMFDKEARAAILDAVAKRADRAANKLASAVRRNISTPGPEPSEPGEYPHKQSGELKSSVKVTRRNQYRIDVSVDAPHAEYVEAIRPFLSRTVNEMFNALRREVERPS